MEEEKKTETPSGMSTFEFKLEIKTSRPSSPVEEAKMGLRAIETLATAIAAAVEAIKGGTGPIVVGTVNEIPRPPDMPPFGGGEPKWLNEVLRKRIEKLEPGSEERLKLVLQAMVERFGPEMAELSIATFTEFVACYRLSIHDLPASLEEPEIGPKLREAGINEVGIAKIFEVFADFEFDPGDDDSDDGSEPAS